jgi:hypothetical protein
MFERRCSDWSAGIHANAGPPNKARARRCRQDQSGFPVSWNSWQNQSNGLMQIALSLRIPSRRALPFEALCHRHADFRRSRILVILTGVELLKKTRRQRKRLGKCMGGAIHVPFDNIP